ncbi:MAG: N-acetyltransferase [Elusimicrobia bacterium]|nr:N-acetyltransferase [Elusimicrobiota bacterium]
MKTKIERAGMADARKIYEIIRRHASSGVVLPRPLSVIYEHIREFFICRIDGKIAGIAALHIVWEDIAEVRSLVVEETFRKQGMGKALVKKCIAEAKKLDIPKVFALTREPDFFIRLGFEKISRKKLPQKVWNDCINCPLFPDCDEVPVIFYLK